MHRELAVSYPGGVAGREGALPVSVRQKPPVRRITNHQFHRINEKPHEKNAMKSIETNKQSAVEFLNMVIAGQIPEAYEKHIDMEGKHHNAFTPAGLTALEWRRPM